MAAAGFCGNCGAALVEGAAFCGSCGHQATGERAGNQSRRRLVAIAVVAALVAIGVGVGVLRASDDGGSGEHEVLLEAAASVGPAPFTPSLQAEDTASSSTPTSTSTSAPSDDAADRRTRAPFGGTGDDRMCDREQLIEFLTYPDNERVARAWARVLDVRVVDIPSFVRSLTPTTLTADARVTNHRWNGTRAVPYQAVLQRGTAVLVDPYGRVVARCRCGNPLLDPEELADPIYTGARWDGFEPTVIVVVIPSPTIIYPAGTVPDSTTPPITSPEDDAVRRIREPFEACARALVAESDGFLVAEDVEALLPRIQYTAEPVAGSAGVYRVHMVIPSSNVASGSFVDGSTATWSVDLSSGAIEPLDDGARQAGECPGLS